MHKPRPCTAVLQRLGLAGSRWRPMIKKGLGGTAAASALCFLLSALLFVAILKNVDTGQWAVAFRSSNFREFDVANQTVIVSEVHQRKDEGSRIAFPLNRTGMRNVTFDTPPVSTDELPVDLPNSKSINPVNRQKIGLEFRLNCSGDGNETARTCPKSYYPATLEPEHDRLFRPSSDPGTCPDYFRWIHEDLLPWRDSGITRDMVERARRTAHFRLVIIDGRAYLDKYRKSIQSRDLFSIWGILQLLRRYPGRIPNLEIMFDCDDQPVVRSKDYRGPNSTSPPPLFRYCGDRWTKDIVFPDWSFWGWPEINIRPWQNLLKELKEGNNRINWSEREPYAYWKGNPYVADTRKDLLKCNVSESDDWNARLFIQDWIKESQQGYNHSGLAEQCTHRYKIYIEGYAWSVSEKYILACDSMTLLVKPHYYDFFTRSLEPLRHYWPIREDDKCRSIKFAVEWGNTHKREAEAMGRAAAGFIEEQVKMDYVYDYMFHLLNEYSKLMKYVPEVPEGAVEICSEALGCSASDGPERKFMMESLVTSPSGTGPCRLPPAFEPEEYGSLWRKGFSAIRRVERWENGYWEGILKNNQTVPN